MNPELAKSVASLIVSIMTFLGWNTSEYANFLPKEIKREIIQTEEKTETQKTDISTSTPISKPETKKPVPKETAEKTKKAENVPIKKPEEPKKAAPQKIVTSTKPVPPSKIPAATPSQPQPVYTPSPIQIKDIIKNEIKSIVEEIVPTKTESEKKVEEEKIGVEEKIQKAIVNIYCSQTIGRQIRKTTGSGIMIDPKGVILTNAHVAEYFLLAQNGNNTSCYIRTDSPAVNTYRAKLVFLPEIWAKRNAGNFSLQTLTGTGEYDYALLTITERMRNDAPNVPFTYLNIDDGSIQNGEDIFVAGYPAGFSDVRVLDNSLYALVKPTEVRSTAGFIGNNSDVIYTGGTSVAEHGSSGGAVTDTKGNLIALIAATNIDSKTGSKNVQAISLSYIKRSIKDTAGKSFESLVSNAKTESTNFEKNISSFVNILMNN